MDWYPLGNSIRVALAATVAAFFSGIFAARRIRHLPRLAGYFLDMLLTLPLILSPSVMGWLILRFFGPRHPLGFWLDSVFGLRMSFSWQSAVLPAFLAAFPLMYRLARRAFRHFDTDLSDAAQTLGHSGAWAFWLVQIPVCWKPLLAGVILSFGRAFGEFGATAMAVGYIPGRTAAASTSVYYLWRQGDQAGALAWVMANLMISAVFLLAVSFLEHEREESGGGEWN